MSSWICEKKMESFLKYFFIIRFFMMYWNLIIYIKYLIKQFYKIPQSTDLLLIWLVFSIFMSLGAFYDIINTTIYISFSLIMLYVNFIYNQL